MVCFSTAISFQFLYTNTMMVHSPCRVSAVALAVLLLVLTTANRPCDAYIAIPEFLFVVAKIVMAYSIYSVAIDRHASRTIDAMMKVPSPFDLLDQNCHDKTNQNNIFSSITPVAELRKTISKVSNLVERPQHRILWNQWAACAMIMNRHHAQNTFSIDDIVSVNGTSTTTYEFAYRSYVNFEEKGSICKGLLSWYIFMSPFVSRDKTILQFSRKQDDNTAVLVTMHDNFWGRRFTPITITWRGHLVSSPPPKRRGSLVLTRGAPSSSSSSSSCCRIQWTSTEMVIGRGSKKKVITNPPAAEELRQIPWDILQEKNGMMLLQRGLIGVLAFDRL